MLSNALDKVGPPVVIGNSLYLLACHVLIYDVFVFCFLVIDTSDI